MSYLHHGTKCNDVFFAAVLNSDIGVTCPKRIVNCFIIGLSIGAPFTTSNIKPFPGVRADGFQGSSSIHA